MRPGRIGRDPHRKDEPGMTTIAFLSDLHLAHASGSKVEALDRALGRIRSAHPDVVCAAGDMTVGSLPAAHLVDRKSVV